jgi:small subunit ribosomal protein S17
MAEEQTPENVEETAGAPAEHVQETAGASAEHAEETAGESAVGDETPRAAADAAAAAPVEPEEVLAPKERRQRARASKASKVAAAPARSPEQRQADRIALRARKARLRREGRAKARAKAKAAPSAEPTPAREHVAGVQQVRQGVVVSDKADKTITVRIDTARRHRRYSKIVRTSQTLHAHDEANDAHVGDTVTVREARPQSRTKRWRLIEVLERAE